jgi:hypothetical protein
MSRFKNGIVVLALFALAAGAVFAAADTGSASLGQITVDYGGFSASRSEIDFVNGVTAVSDQYNLASETLAITLPKGKSPGSMPFEKAVALGSATAQVHIKLDDTVNGRSYDIMSDKAVLTPDPSRPRGASLVMTGNVVVKIRTAAFAEPSLTTVLKMTVLLGPSPDYPLLEAEHGHTTIVPAQ